MIIDAIITENGGAEIQNYDELIKPLNLVDHPSRYIPPEQIKGQERIHAEFGGVDCSYWRFKEGTLIEAELVPMPDEEDFYHGYMDEDGEWQKQEFDKEQYQDQLALHQAGAWRAKEKK